MQLFIDTINNTFINDALFRSPLNEVSFKRGDSANVQIAFVNDGTIVSMLSSRLITFGIKEAGKYDANFLVTASDYTISGNYYVLNPSFNTVQINDLLNSDDDNENNDIESILGMLEVTWSDNEGDDWTSTNVIDAIIENDVCKGGEATPTPSQTMIEWMAEYHPTPLVLSAAPVDASESADIFVTNAALSYSERRFFADYTSNGKQGYTASDETFIEWQTTYTPARWVLRYDATLYFYTEEDVTTPDLVTAWTVDSGSGTLTVTGGSGTAGKIGQDAIVNLFKLLQMHKRNPC